MVHPPRLGLRENAAQFTLLVIVNALVGGMVGQQQTTLPLLAEQVFSLTGYSYVFAYVAAFGISKAASNYVAGVLSDRHGRKPVLLTGWILGLPVPLLIMWAPSWEWIIVANVLLGINQGLAWSTTVTMKIDLVGPRQRGLAMGLNEAAGYLAVSLTSLAAGMLAAQYGLRPAPFLLGVAYAVLALVIVTLLVHETRGHVALEAPSGRANLSNTAIIADVTWRHPALSSASVAGMANNLNFGLSWGVFPLLFAGAGLSLGQIGLLVALYPLVWGLGQLAAGWISDHIGRKPLVVGGMALQAGAPAVIAWSEGMGGWVAGTILLGLGSAMVYPALLAVIGDVADPAWRGRAVGVYRVWRDLGYTAGALLGGLTADALGLHSAVWAAAVLSGLVTALVAYRLTESHPGLP